MAQTIVNTPNPSSNDSSAGWAVAVIILLAVIVGGFFLFRHGFTRVVPAPTQPGANINVTLPSNTGNSGAGNVAPSTGAGSGQAQSQ